MRLLAEVWERVSALLFGAREDRELDEELRFHLEMETQKFIDTGMSTREARRQARLRFGSVDRYTEEVREARGVRPLENLGRDLRFATRMLRKRLLSSGRLADIDNSMIRRALAAWPSEVGDAQEDENLARDFVENVVAQVLLGQGILESAYRSRPLPGDLDEEIEPDSSTTFSISPELIEIATIRIIHSKMASRSISRLRVRIRQILELIDAELEDV